MFTIWDFYQQGANNLLTDNREERFQLPSFQKRFSSNSWNNMSAWLEASIAPFMGMMQYCAPTAVEMRVPPNPFFNGTVTFRRADGLSQEQSYGNYWNEFFQGA